MNSPRREGSRRLLIIAGEASGDLHGSNLIEALKELPPAIEVFGIGGPHMMRAGCRLLFDCRQLGQLGIVEVAGALWKVWRLYRQLRKEILARPPDLVVLIDFPEFNLRVAKVARRAGVPVVYYICPQVWAWRQRRARVLARWANRLIVVLPFEVEFYKRAGVVVDYVGHPVLDVVVPTMDREQALGKFGLSGSGKIVALMPGSRRSETRYILPRMLRAAELIRGEIKDTEFILPLAPTLEYGWVSSFLKEARVAVRVVQGYTYDAINLSDVVVVASGTATLEVALLATPMVMVYAVSPVSYALGIRLLRVKEYSLANLILGRKAVPELIQREFTAEATCREVVKLLKDPAYYEVMVEELKKVRDLMGDGGASKRAAMIISDMLR